MTNASDRRDSRLQFINKKGWEIAQRLMKVKAGQRLVLSDIKGVTMDDTDEPPEVRLRRFLDQINNARTRLDTPEYGACTQCGAAFHELQLDEMPWVEYCQPCDAKM